MAAPAGSVLPDSYFDGLSQLWGGCAYLAGAIATAGFVFTAATSRHDPGDLIKLVVRVFFVGLAIVFLREWLMRLNDVVSAFGDYMSIDPAMVDEKFTKFVAGTSESKPDASVWDVIWDTGSVGTAIAYALLWLFGWLAWGFQYIVKLVGDILLSAGWALSPIFLSFFMVRPMAGVGLKYVIGLVALVCWPFGWIIAAVVTNAMLDAAARASLVPILVPGATSATVLTVLLIGTWMIVSSILAPYVSTRILLMGANPAGALAQAVGGVGRAALVGGVSAGTAAVTGGASAAAVIAASAVGASASAAESAARGGGYAEATSTATRGMTGFYGAGYARRGTQAAEGMATAFSRMADAADSMASSRAEQAEFFRDARRRMSRDRPMRSAQPHTEDPNQAAIEIEAYAKN
jgi:type IV secretion system protein TrbL